MLSVRRRSLARVKCSLQQPKGVLQADAFAEYNNIFADGLVKEVACMAYARRNPDRCSTASDSGNATQAERVTDTQVRTANQLTKLIFHN